MLSDLLDRVVNVYKPAAPTRDASGGIVQPVNVPAYANVPAAVQSEKNVVVDGFGQRVILDTTTVYLEGVPTLDRGWQIYEPSTGRLFVVDGESDEGGKGVVTGVQVTRIR